MWAHWVRHPALARLSLHPPPLQSEGYLILRTAWRTQATNFLGTPRRRRGSNTLRGKRWFNAPWPAAQNDSNWCWPPTPRHETAKLTFW
eukprot:4449612-Alexandrium_andersonii.AAC.1